MEQQAAHKEVTKVTYLADDLTSIQTLKDLIDDIRNDRLENFVVMAQSRAHGETEVTAGAFGLDDPEASGKVLKYYFFGESSNSYHLGLCNRMAYLINKYMDGDDIFFDEEDYDG